MMHRLLLTLMACGGLACQSNADALDLALPDAAIADAQPDSMTIDQSDFDANVMDLSVADSSPTDQTVADADPRANDPLWSPAFGPIPAEMPEEIQWMHGRMWCPGERPPRTLPDGSSECDYVDQPTPVEFQGSEDDNGCREWPHRTTDRPYIVGDHGGSIYACNPDQTLCCSFAESWVPPCGWIIWNAHNPYTPPHGEPGGPVHAWLEANGLDVSVPRPDGPYPDVFETYFRDALNNCHPICKAPACE